MAVDQAPIQEKTTNDMGYFPQVWIKWFENLRRVVEAIRIATFEYTIICKTKSDLSNLQSGFTYFIDGEIDMGDTPITIPNGANIKFMSDSLNNKGLYSTANNYTMFVTPSGASAGNITCQELYLTVTGTGSKIFDLDNDGNNGACEFIDVNFGTFSRGQTTEIGEFSSYRQFRASGCAFINCALGITFNGTMTGGAVLSDSIALSLPAMTLIKEGTSLLIEGSFRSDMNFNSVNSATVFTDIREANISQKAGFTLSGFRTTAANAIPNISSNSEYVKFSNCVGVKNTYIEGNWTCTAAVATTFTAINTPSKVAGTTTTFDNGWFEQTANNELTYIGDQPLEVFASYPCSFTGTLNDNVNIFLRQYDASASAYVDDFIRRPKVNQTMQSVGVFVRTENVSVVGHFSIENGDRIELWAENTSDTNSITMVTGSNGRVNNIPS